MQYDNDRMGFFATKMATPNGQNTFPATDRQLSQTLRVMLLDSIKFEIQSSTARLLPPLRSKTLTQRHH